MQNLTQSLNNIRVAGSDGITMRTLKERGTAVFRDELPPYYDSRWPPKLRRRFMTPPEFATFCKTQGFQTF